MIEALDRVGDPLVGAERTAGDGLDVALLDLNEPPVAQRLLRRERVPGRIVKERQREGKRE
jgi:hypothetical protein